MTISCFAPIPNIPSMCTIHGLVCCQISYSHCATVTKYLEIDMVEIPSLVNLVKYCGSTLKVCRKATYIISM